MTKRGAPPNADEVARARAILDAHKRHQRGLLIRRGGIALVLLCGISMVVSLLNGDQGQETAQLPTLAVLPSATPLPLDTPTPTLTLRPEELTDAAIGTQSAAYVQTSVVELTAMAQPSTSTPEPTSTASLTPVPPDRFVTVTPGRAFSGDAPTPDYTAIFNLIPTELHTSPTPAPAPARLIGDEESALATDRGLLVSDALQNVPGVVASRATAYERLVLVDVMVESSFNSRAMAQQIYSVAENILGSPEDLLIRIQGDGRFVEYRWWQAEWHITELIPMDIPLVDLPTATSTRVPPTLPPARPTIASLPISTPLQGSMYACNGLDDLNCDDFARGSGSATSHLQQCGDEDQLDRDGDGRACEDGR